jgi:hypothetical protein
MVRLVKQHVYTPPDRVMTIRRPFPLILIIVATTALAAGFLYQPTLPHPRDADREQLVRWLVLRDLRGESDELRLTLVQRLEEEFSAEVDWDSMSDRLTQSQQKRLRDNLVLLLRPWFMSKLEGYFSLPVPQRAAYVDELLDTITSWSGVDTLQGCNPEDAQHEQSLLEILQEKTAKWQAEAAQPLRGQICEFLVAIVLRAKAGNGQGPCWVPLPTVSMSPNP